ncbi:exonuclease phage-type/recb c-terminal domain-containing protein [Holotrichia oblita]|uniref:Exonuclease phage-type/recb c-terminal domain-containing protein n=1 Tax=Holotrichia oblita TaxID=644536 RepID=A0ACB9SI93_HOLOL|nr:exonuclease phage-type/recb c-terminal domain-containing protein [Holotrichia oblita]
MSKCRVRASRVHKRSARSKVMKNLFQNRNKKEVGIDDIASSSKDTSDYENSQENMPPLEIEPDLSYKTISDVLRGRRIVNLAHVLKEYENIILHRTKCSMGRMDIVKETRRGIISLLHFHCMNCEKSYVISTDPSWKDNDSSNTSIVWGSLSVGLGHSQCEEIFGILDIPFMATKTYAKITLDIKKGVIIGAETKKPLYLGVRNKLCSACAYYKRNKVPPKHHTCSLNFSGPSTAMEQDIIVEGFCLSLSQHGIIYKYLIADGDSSVYARIVEKVQYGRDVVKIECANHMTRCVSDKLYKLAANTRYPLLSRKLLTERVDNITRIERLVKGVRTAIKNNCNNPTALSQELSNAASHVFGRHTNCRAFCKKKNLEDENLVANMDDAVWMEIKKIIEPLINKSDRLSYNVTTNQAERYMSLIAKCTGGKRVNFSKRWSYTTRAYAAAISHSHGPGWHKNTWRGAIGKYFNILCEKRNRICKKMQGKSSKKRKRTSPVSDIHYGPNASAPDINTVEMIQKTELFLNTLNVRASLPENRNNIEISTRGQHDNSYWKELRKSYLTASNFGQVIKRKADTHCHNLVKKLLYTSKEILSPAILFGRTHEQVAIDKYESSTDTEVRRCGFFIDEDNPFLGASPDGLVGNNGLIEVKCLYSVNKLMENHKKNVCYNIRDSQIQLKRNHNYYYQIQGQLNITKKEFCDFIIFTKDDFHVERIFKDRELWHEQMLPKLQSFYRECILPEIIDGRVPRGMKIRDPKDLH